MARYWSINGRFLTQPLSGVQRYAQEIVRGLDELVSEGHPLTRDMELELVTPPARSARWNWAPSAFAPRAGAGGMRGSSFRCRKRRAAG